MKEFHLIEKREIEEISSKAALYEHEVTGARLFSILNDDENRVFGINFRTPPKDSTGIAHILEHSVLCGSRKYPLKEPFLELLKSSLKTFLNAMTYPDKTCYPVASQNLKDFYNLIDVYLDAVFFPLLDPYKFYQEGWHYELDSPDGELSIKGVVFNEMKGSHSSPDNLLMELSRRSLFPDTPYGFDSGGDPEEIPKLTYSEFKRFHERFYHPSNSYIFFYGDDSEEERFNIVHEYLKDFQKKRIDSIVPLQKRFSKPKKIERPYPIREGEEEREMLTINWLLSETMDLKTNFSLHILEHILIGTPASPLRKALIDSGLGEELAGVGLEDELRQLFFSTGLKGIRSGDSSKVEDLIFSTIESLIRNGIPKDIVEASLNSVEFILRENNTGGLPRGLILMLRSLSIWLYGENPMEILCFDRYLKDIKRDLDRDRFYFENILNDLFLENTHRTVVTLKADPGFFQRKAERERQWLREIRSKMKDKEIKEIIEINRKLKKRQASPDPIDALSKLPTLSISDLEREEKEIPIEKIIDKEGTFLFHNIKTNGIIYLDMGFNLSSLPQRLLPYIPLFGRALLEMGTEKENYVSLSIRIARETGGIFPTMFISHGQDLREPIAWLFLRGKALFKQAHALMDIYRDILTIPLLNNRERFLQMVLEEKARFEEALIPSGHRIVGTRISAGLNDAGWLEEITGGISYLWFLKELKGRVEDSWDKVLEDLRSLYSEVFKRQRVIINITIDEECFIKIQDELISLFELFSDSPIRSYRWEPELSHMPEAIIFPSQVNYVGMGIDLSKYIPDFNGSYMVISRFIRNSYLWDRIRVQGGAYGAFCNLNRFSKTLIFLSYRDPHIVKTIDVFKETGRFLENVSLNKMELERAIIGTIGEIDKYRLPDAKGFVSMLRYLTGDTHTIRQKIRSEVLNTGLSHFREFGKILNEGQKDALIKVLGPDREITKSEDEISIKFKKLNIN